MTAKNKRIPVKNVKRGHHKVFTDNDKIQMLSMYHKDKITQQEIAEHFGTTRQNVNRLLKKLNTNIEVKDATMFYNSDEILKRRTLSTVERERLVTQDAIEVAEYTLSIAKYQLENLIRSVGTADEFQLIQINMDKLVKLLQTTLPYVIPKLDAQTMKKEEPKKQLMHLHKLMTKTSSSLNSR